MTAFDKVFMIGLFAALGLAAIFVFILIML